MGVRKQITSNKNAHVTMTWKKTGKLEELEERETEKINEINI